MAVGAPALPCHAQPEQTLRCWSPTSCWPPALSQLHPGSLGSLKTLLNHSARAAPRRAWILARSHVAACFQAPGGRQHLWLTTRAQGSPPCRDGRQDGVSSQETSGSARGQSGPSTQAPNPASPIADLSPVHSSRAESDGAGPHHPASRLPPTLSLLASQELELGRGPLSSLNQTVPFQRVMKCVPGKGQW